MGITSFSSWLMVLWSVTETRDHYLKEAGRLGEQVVLDLATVSPAWPPALAGDNAEDTLNINNQFSGYFSLRDVVIGCGLGQMTWIFSCRSALSDWTLSAIICRQQSYFELITPREHLKRTPNSQGIKSIQYMIFYIEVCVILRLWISQVTKPRWGS